MVSPRTPLPLLTGLNELHAPTAPSVPRRSSRVPRHSSHPSSQMLSHQASKSRPSGVQSFSVCLLAAFQQAGCELVPSVQSLGPARRSSQSGSYLNQNMRRDVPGGGRSPRACEAAPAKRPAHLLRHPSAATPRNAPEQIPATAIATASQQQSLLMSSAPRARKGHPHLPRLACADLASLTARHARGEEPAPCTCYPRRLGPGPRRVSKETQPNHSKMENKAMALPDDSYKRTGRSVRSAAAQPHKVLQVLASVE